MRLSVAAQGSFRSVASERSHGEGSQIIAVGDEDTAVFLLLEGRADVLIYAADGKVVAFDEVGPGDLVGELAALDGKPRSASVVARTPARTARATGAEFLALMERPAFAHEVQMALAAKVRELSERVFEFSTLLVRERLVRELVRRTEAVASGDGPVRLSPAPTQFDLAARIATHREAVSREMSRLARLGVLQRAGGDLVVPSARALRAITDEAET